MTHEKWTQEQAIAYECARELIGHLIAIKSEQIERERCKPTLDQERIEALCRERTVLDQERQELHVTDDTAVARIRKDYGTTIRAHLNDGPIWSQ